MAVPHPLLYYIWPGHAHVTAHRAPGVISGFGVCVQLWTDTLATSAVRILPLCPPQQGTPRYVLTACSGAQPA